MKSDEPAEALTRVALFPLSTVLFPQGVLPLRVFEARYMDMVRDCMRDGTSFGVCLITDTKGSSIDAVPVTADVGCLTRITAWDMQQLGLLQIRTVGGDRFRLLASEAQPNGLMIGEIEIIGDDDDQPVSAEHRPCVELLTRIIEDMSAQMAEKRRTGEAADVNPVLAQLPFEQPYQMDSSAWVSNRLCEVLPVPLKAKQKLMELTDAATRLEIVHTYLKQHSVLK
ncbi:MAG: LON peptidase substrate-binding domain-containing protein [Burkholderiaceae bacterium]